MDDIFLKLLLQLEEKKLSSKYWNISWELGEELYGLVKQENPLNVLEVGTSNGFSSLWITRALSCGAQLTTVEINDERFEEAKEIFSQIPANFNIVQLKGNIFDCIDSKKLDTSYDFIFIDAAQRFYFDLVLELELGNYIGQGACLVFDNVLSHKNMGLFLTYMSYDYNCTFIKKDSGFLIARKKTKV